MSYVFLLSIFSIGALNVIIRVILNFLSNNCNILWHVLIWFWFWFFSLETVFIGFQCAFITLLKVRHVVWGSGNWDKQALSVRILVNVRYGLCLMFAVGARGFRFLWYSFCGLSFWFWTFLCLPLQRESSPCSSFCCNPLLCRSPVAMIVRWKRGKYSITL